MEYTTKFNPGETVWTIYENKVHSFRIARIEINIRPCYRNDGTLHPSPMMSEFLYEERHTQTRNNPVTIRHNWYDCYPTKEELLKSL